MKKLKGNLLYGQSGGPTSVINASAYGVIKEAFLINTTINWDAADFIACGADTPNAIIAASS